jgi:hypothetical protein
MAAAIGYMRAPLTVQLGCTQIHRLVSQVNGRQNYRADAAWARGQHRPTFEVQGLRQQGADVLRLLIHGRLGSDHQTILLMRCLISVQ